MSENNSPKKVKIKTVKVTAEPKNHSGLKTEESVKERIDYSDEVQSSNTVLDDNVGEIKKSNSKKNTSKNKKRNILLAVAAVLVLLFIIASIGDSDKEATVPDAEVVTDSQTNVTIPQSEGDTSSVSYVTNSNSVWLNGYTDINDFEYYIDGTEIYIKKYHGNSEKVRVAPTYDINGVTCNVVSFEDATFLFSGVSSVIIPNGTRYLANNTFNTSGVKFLYLPNSLTGIENTFWGYFHDVQKIYYGGTQDEWNTLYNNGGMGLDAKQIVFGQNPDELK